MKTGIASGFREATKHADRFISNMENALKLLTNPDSEEYKEYGAIIKSGIEKCEIRWSEFGYRNDDHRIAVVNKLLEDLGFLPVNNGWSDMRTRVTVNTEGLRFIREHGDRDKLSMVLLTYDY